MSCVLPHGDASCRSVKSGNLVFVLKGGDGKLDPVCKEAVAAVENAY